MSTSMNQTAESFQASDAGRDWKRTRSAHQVEKRLSDPETVRKLLSVIGDVHQRSRPSFDDEIRGLWTAQVKDRLKHMSSPDEIVAELGKLVSKALPTVWDLSRYAKTVAVPNTFSLTHPEEMVYVIYLWIDFNFTNHVSASNVRLNTKYAITRTDWSTIYSLLVSANSQPSGRADSDRSRSPVRTNRLLGFFSRRGSNELYSPKKDIDRLCKAINRIDESAGVELAAESNGEGSSSSAAAAEATKETDNDSLMELEREKTDEEEKREEGEEEEEQVSLNPAYTVDDRTAVETAGFSNYQAHMFKYALLATFTAICITGAFRCLDKFRIPPGWLVYQE